MEMEMVLDFYLQPDLGPGDPGGDTQTLKYTAPRTSLPGRGTHPDLLPVRAVSSFRSPRVQGPLPVRSPHPVPFWMARAIPAPIAYATLATRTLSPSNSRALIHHRQAVTSERAAPTPYRAANARVAAGRNSAPAPGTR